VNPLLQGTEQTALPGRLNAFYLDGRTIPLQLPIAHQLGLRDNQIIHGTIELRGQTVQLMVNGQWFELPAGLRFRPGEQVWLRANRSAGGWTLKAVDRDGSPSAAAPSAAPPDDSAQPALSRLLALSLRPPMSPTLLDLFAPAALRGLLQSGAGGELAAQVQRLQLSMRGLTPDVLQNAVLSSGFWLEALLGRGQMSPSPDTKSMLRKLIRALGDKETAQVSQLKKAVDDIESAQVESLAAQARGELSFSMVLPFRDANPVEIKFFRPPRRPGQERPPFSVDIHTNNDVLGEIWMKTSVSRAAHVDLMMWALKPAVVRLAQRHSDALAKRLALAGLTMDSFRIFNTARPSLPEGWAAAPGSVLDVIA
jgi:hypothetical protein